jgi:general secretion pathway protein D
MERLDKPAEGTDKKIFVYHVQNGRATDVANTLLRALFGSGAPQQSAAQPTPNSTMSGTQSSDSFSAANSAALSPMNGASTNDSSGGDLSGGTAPSHPSTPTSSFQPVTSPVQGQSQQPHGYETIGGVSREGINSVNITADEANNALVVLATPREYAVIQDALRQLDVAPTQVLLEAAIAEVTLTKETKYGFQYFAQNSHNTGVLTQSSSLPASTGLQITPSLPGFSYMFMNGNNIQVILSALGTVTHVDVISSPEVMVLNNQMASLEVGDQVPILTGQAQSTLGTDAPIVNSVQYLDTGVILRVTPRVNRSGQVMMDISQEVSGVNTAATSVSTIGSPTIQQRKINSSVAVGDGETVALGGLFSDTVSLSHDGIPYLQDIPILGNLFRATDNSHDRTELMVLITPHVVDDARKARAVTDELRRKLPEVEPLFEKPG